MKIDRLLSIIIYLLNRELVPARELADRFEVTVRTIQRDIETIALAGIPIMSVQGPGGGYSIMDTYKMDRRLMSADDMYFIIKALKGISDSIEDRGIDSTLEKMTGLVPPSATERFLQRDEKLHIDFSMLGGNEEHRRVLRKINEAVQTNRLLSFRYTNNNLESSIRTVEPMTIVFMARAWYLYGYCRLREDYRIFRASKIRDPEIFEKSFARRNKSFKEFQLSNNFMSGENQIDIKLRFSAIMKPMLEDYYREEDFSYRDDRHIILNLRMPENGWLYGYILSFGEFVEVLAPEHLRTIIRSSAGKILDIYE